MDQSIDVLNTIKLKQIVNIKLSLLTSKQK